MTHQCPSVLSSVPGRCLSDRLSWDLTLEDPEVRPRGQTRTDGHNAHGYRTMAVKPEIISYNIITTLYQTSALSMSRIVTVSMLNTHVGRSALATERDELSTRVSQNRENTRGHHSILTVRLPCCRYSRSGL